MLEFFIKYVDCWMKVQVAKYLSFSFLFQSTCFFFVLRLLLLNLISADFERESRNFGELLNSSEMVKMREISDYASDVSLFLNYPKIAWLKELFNKTKFANHLNELITIILVDCKAWVAAFKVQFQWWISQYSKNRIFKACKMRFAGY